MCYVCGGNPESECMCVWLRSSGPICREMGRDGGRQMRKSIDFLLQVTTPTAGLRRIRVLVSPYRTPHRWNLHRREHTASARGTAAEKKSSRPRKQKA